MKIALALAFVVASSVPGAAAAQSRLNLNVVTSTPAPGMTRPFAMPVVDYSATPGRIAFRRGIIAGVDVSPNAAFGLGLFEGAPKRRLGAADPAKPERRSRRAAVGFSFKF